MNFGKALEAVKKGEKIFRLGWNGVHPAVFSQTVKGSVEKLTQ
jgi:hypothetical protein